MTVFPLGVAGGFLLGFALPLTVVLVWCACLWLRAWWRDRP